MFNKALKKTIYTLDLDNKYPKSVTDLTYPLMKLYADKIGAEFHIISERKFPDWPATYEKFQIYELAQEHNNDWNIFLDCDALVHPDTPDITNIIPFNTVAHHGVDYSGFRWKDNRFFQRDGRRIGSCNWMAIASSLNIELWEPIHNELTQDDIANSITPILAERKSGIIPIRLIDDYICSYNIAKYNLRYTTLASEMLKLGMDTLGFFWHIYAVTEEEKTIKMNQQLKVWGLV